MASRLTEMPATVGALARLEPVYQTKPGWKESTRGVAQISDLPAKAKEYIHFLEQQIGVEIGCVSTGPERNQTIVIAGSTLESLLSSPSRGSKIVCMWQRVAAVFILGLGPLWAQETPDLGVYARIREEGMTRSRVMEYAAELIDGIGPRLTGSRNLEKAEAWAMRRLEEAGCVRVRKQSWGEFGMAWQERNVWLRMTEPDTSPLIARATPWSPATKGPLRRVGGRARILQREGVRNTAGEASREGGAVWACSLGAGSHSDREAAV